MLYLYSMNYELALQKSLTVLWELDVCNEGEQCWCRIIRTVEKIEYVSESEGPSILDCVVDYGSIDKETAEYVVGLHNRSLKKESVDSNLEAKKLSLFENYEDAHRYILTIPWELDVCNVGENCWCRLILPTEKEIKYTHKFGTGKEIVEEIEYIIPDGSIHKTVAEYIVNLHNKKIQKKKKKKIKYELELQSL
jgi:hypothetical protein